VKSLRGTISRSSFGNWKPAGDRPDPLAILAAQERDRIPALIPVRHQRMRASPFAFYRGGAAIMAADLAAIPVTGLHAQIGGDAHLANFGVFGTPERNVIFDVNDFDETLPGPWEWDVMRLCASIPLAGLARGMRKATLDDAVFESVKSYQTWMRRYAEMSPLDVWYARIDVASLTGRSNARHAEDWRRALEQADAHAPAQHFSSSSEFFHRVGASEPEAGHAISLVEQYSASLLPSVQVLFNRYHFADLASKIVGVGSVGTHCYVALFLDECDDALVLQLKEAQASVLEAYLPVSLFDNHGQRVVNGQHLMQAASDIFLGWLRFDGRDYYVRQLRDMKGSVDLTTINADELIDYAAHCAWTLARAHARSGEGKEIAAYLGSNDAFAEAIVRFANAYAVQVGRDYEEFKAKVRD
jgi:uncharacterized protein (DUF2252 family)